MPNPLASPVFRTGATDKLAAVDVYKVQQQQGQVVNSIKSLLQQYDPKLARSLAGFNSLDIQGITRGLLGNTAMGNTANQLMNRALALNPGIASTIRSLDTSIRENLSGVMGKVSTTAGDLVGSAKDTVGGWIGDAKDSASSFFSEKIGSNTFDLNDPENFKCTAGGVIAGIPIENVFQTQQMGSLVNSITGGQSMVFNDIGGQVGLYTSTIKECFDCNVSGVTKDIFATIADQQVLSIVARAVVPDVLRYSSVSDLFTLGENLYEGELLAATPGILNIFTRSFGQDKKSQYYNYPTQKHIATYAELLQAYNAAYPGWNRYVRRVEGGEVPINEEIINISPLIDGSATFNAVLTAGARNSSLLAEKPYLMAPLIKGETVESRLQKQYQRTKFYFDTPVSKISDPRSLNRI